MKNTFTYLLSIASLFIFSFSNGQSPDTISKKEIPSPFPMIAPAVIPDTVKFYQLQEFVVTASDSMYKRKYDFYYYIIQRTYPYARMAKKLLDEYNADLTAMNSGRKSKKYVNEKLEELKDRFTNGVMTMTVSEGKVLVKLVHRETGMTAYKIANDYLGSVRAFMWQSVSRAGGANLKLEYKPEAGDDRIIEEIVKKIESGKIKVAAEPEVIENRREYIKKRKAMVKMMEEERKKKASAAVASKRN